MSGSMQKALLSSTPVDDNDVKEFTSAKPLRKASKSDIEDLLGVKVDSALFTNVNDNGKSSSRRQSFDDGGNMVVFVVCIKLLFIRFVWINWWLRWELFVKWLFPTVNEFSYDDVWPSLFNNILS